MSDQARKLLLRTGCAEVHGSEDRHEAVTRRDAGLRAWFEEETGRRLLSGDSAESIMALTREVCSLKLAQAQLAANESAAKMRLAAGQQQEAVLQVQNKVSTVTSLVQKSHEYVSLVAQDFSE